MSISQPPECVIIHLFDKRMNITYLGERVLAEDALMLAYLGGPKYNVMYFYKTEVEETQGKEKAM